MLVTARIAQFPYLECPLAMARGPAPFKKADVIRLVQAARAGGLNVAGVEVTPDGTLRVIEMTSPNQRLSDFDRLEQEL